MSICNREHFLFAMHSSCGHGFGMTIMVSADLPISIVNETEPCTALTLKSVFISYLDHVKRIGIGAACIGRPPGTRSARLTSLRTDRNA